MPLVSVIIPTHNRAPMLGEAINSVLKQTFRDFELIIVDDGSTDNSKAVVQTTAPTAKYIYQENKGVSAARNAGIQLAQGNYLAFLDSDDLWKKNKLSIQMQQILADPVIKICYTNEVWFRNGRHLNQKKKHQKYSGWILEKMLTLCLISASSVVIAREVFQTVGLFDEHLIVCEDYDLWLRIAVRYPVTFIDQTLIIKRGGHPDQLSHRYWGMDRFRVKALEKLLLNPDLKVDQKPAVLKTLIEKCHIIALGALKRGYETRAEHYQALVQTYKKILIQNESLS